MNSFLPFNDKQLEDIIQKLAAMYATCEDVTIKGLMSAQITSYREIQRLRKVLKIYANRRNYFEIVEFENSKQETEVVGLVDLPAGAKIMKDQGKLARQALGLK